MSLSVSHFLSLKAFSTYICFSLPQNQEYVPAPHPCQVKMYMLDEVDMEDRWHLWVSRQSWDGRHSQHGTHAKLRVLILGARFLKIWFTFT